MGRYNSSVYRIRRRQLFFPDPSMPNSRAALAELEENYDALASTGRAWYVFEGFTNPDIFIQGALNDTNKRLISKQKQKSDR